MIETVLVVGAIFFPAIYSYVTVRRLEDRAEEYFQQALARVEHRDRGVWLPSDESKVATTQSIGDRSCQNNARSPYLRCAVNPMGPCEHCPFYERVS